MSKRLRTTSLKVLQRVLCVADGAWDLSVPAACNWPCP